MKRVYWQFQTAQFHIKAYVVADNDPDLSFDETGEVLADLEAGRLFAFGVIVEVEKNGHVIGSDSLWGSIYKDPREFFTGHRTATADGRNTLAMKAQNKVICHYFPGMVSEAIADARRTLGSK